MKTLYNPFDVVKFADAANIHTTNAHAKDYIGIVKEPADNVSYIVTNLSGWTPNGDVTVVGSLYHLITSKTSALASSVMTKAKNNGTVATEAKPKRKYTRKPGAAKPGPKPKKDKVVKPIAAKSVVKAEPAANKTVLVPTPIGRYGKPLDKDYFTSRSRYCFATGKFKHFKTRQAIDQSISDCAYLYKHMNYNLDFVIVGEKPGPAKLNKLHALGIPVISEEQWLALIGAKGFEFDPVATNDARMGIPAAATYTVE